MVVLMKKLSLYILISLMVSWSAISDELNSINKLIENGYKIISEDIVSSSNSNRFIKTFTLQNKKSDQNIEVENLKEVNVSESYGPAVRRMLEEFNLDPKNISGTGKDGRISKADIKNYLENLVTKNVFNDTLNQ